MNSRRTSGVACARLGKALPEVLSLDGARLSFNAGVALVAVERLCAADESEGPMTLAEYARMGQDPVRSRALERFPPRSEE
jgi:hypothetical protein